MYYVNKIMVQNRNQIIVLATGSHVFGYPAVYRRYTDSDVVSNMFVIPRPNDVMHWAEGNITRWHFTAVQLNTSSSTSSCCHHDNSEQEDKIMLQVWRRQSALTYMLVGQTEIFINLSQHTNQHVTLRQVKPKRPIEFRAGDVLGFRAGFRHSIPFDTYQSPAGDCIATTGTLTAGSVAAADDDSTSDVTVGDMVTFHSIGDSSQGVCRMYSLFVSLHAEGM